MAEPAYAFTLPSIEDGLALDCRIYHPKDLIQRLYRGEPINGAIVAHPYAPLGGCYDDAVVISVTETLLELGCVVGTFNFRGAGGSAGRTSWTGRAEQNDYASVVGFLTQYLSCLKIPEDGTHSFGESYPAHPEEQPVSNSKEDSSLPQQGTGKAKAGTKHLSMILAGYSYGSLILARLSAISAILNHFYSAPLGTPAAEILLRAQTLAKQTLKAHLPETPTLRGRQHADSNASVASEARRGTASPITLGNAEDATARRPRSHDSLVRRSLELPGKKLKAHMRRHSHQNQQNDSGSEDKEASKVSSSPSPASSSTPSKTHAKPGTAHARSLSYTQPDHGKPFDQHDSYSSLATENVQVSYLLISPVLIPLAHTLMPPGGFNFWRSRASDTKAHSRDAKSQDEGEGKDEQFRKAPTLVVFGSEDAFTSEKRLRGWALAETGRVRAKGEGDFEWALIKNAGHFWREDGVMRRLKETILAWVAGLDTKTRG